MKSDPRSLSDDELLRINQLCNDFESACKTGPVPRVEVRLKDLPPELFAAALRELLPLEVEYRQRASQPPTRHELEQRFPEADPAWLSELSDADEIPEQLGDYRLLERIGGGGMGTVYKAVHQRMDRTVALKVLRREIQRDPALLLRFNREVRAAARLTHPNIVAALDAREENGLHYLITEFVAGCDLEETVRRNGPLPVGEAIDCILQAARGLDYAHRQGVVHRDIKPANLLRDQQGTVKVLDVGLARLEEADDSAAANLTQSGMVMGTAAYMAPEQARDTRRADARSDLYSLGCTLFFLIAGRPVFRGESVVDTILSHVSQPIPSLNAANAQVPPELDRVFRRLVAKSPEDRFQSAAELIAALESIRDPHGINDPVSAPSTIAKPIAAPPVAMPPINDTAIAPTVVLLDLTNAHRTTPSARRFWIAAAGLLGVAIVVLILANRFRGPVDYALKFDGKSNYVAVRNLEPAAGETYTLELIVQPEEIDGTHPANVISWLGPDWMAIYHDANRRWGVARFWNGESYLRLTSQSMTPGTKVHLAGVFDGSNLRLFIDGVDEPTQPNQFLLSQTTGGLFIGGADLERLKDNRFFRGQVHSVRISRGIRYTDRFTPPKQLQADAETLLLLPFQEGEGSTTSSSDSRWAGEIVGATWQPLHLKETPP